MGLSSSGSTADLSVTEWARQLLVLLDKAGIELDLKFSFVDDIRVVLYALLQGVDFCTRCREFTLTKEKEEADRRSGESDMKRTADILKKAFNSIEKDLKFTVETQEDFEKGQLPTLDTSLKLVEMEIQTETGHVVKYKQIVYEFYSKPTGSKFTLLESSATPNQQKKSTLSQEIVRRLLDTSEEAPLEKKLEILNNFDNKLEVSGYDARQRRDILESGVVGYKRKIERQEGVRHRKNTDTKGERLAKKLCGKTTWYKKKSHKSHNRKLVVLWCFLDFP